MGYTAEDEALIKEKWDALLFSCTKICKNDEDWDFIKRAFSLPRKHTRGYGAPQRRTVSPASLLQWPGLWRTK